MKAKILSVQGKEVKEIVLPKCFSSRIREDIAQKYYETVKKMQPRGSYALAGMQYSASGKLRHRRNKWKTTYGRGISRVPRKIFWRRGTQFYWVGATVAGTVGGRKAHPPKVEGFMKEKRINRKEVKIAICSAISSTASSDYLKRRYQRIEEAKNLPLVIESKMIGLKTKDFISALKKILGENYEVALKKKNKRAGRGKTRGRKYKKSAGLLLVIGKDENFKSKNIEVRKVNELGMDDLWPLGRLAVYTENAIQDLSKLWEKEK